MYINRHTKWTQSNISLPSLFFKLYVWHYPSESSLWKQMTHLYFSFKNPPCLPTKDERVRALVWQWKRQWKQSACSHICVCIYVGVCGAEYVCVDAFKRLVQTKLRGNFLKLPKALRGNLILCVFWLVLNTRKRVISMPVCLWFPRKYLVCVVGTNCLTLIFPFVKRLQSNQLWWLKNH